MNFSSINWLAVVACVVFSMVSGSIWYAPKTFFPVWWQAIGKKDSDVPKATPLTWVFVIVSSIVQAISMSLLVTAMGSLTGGATLASGALAGFMLWLGIVAPTSLVNKLFSNQYKAWAIETGNHLINFVVFGAILGAWR